MMVRQSDKQTDRQTDRQTDVFCSAVVYGDCNDDDDNVDNNDTEMVMMTKGMTTATI